MKKMRLSCLAGAALACLSGSAFAVTLSVVPATSAPLPGTSVVGVELRSADMTNSRGWNLTLEFPVGLTAANVVGDPNAGSVLGALGSCSFVGQRLIVTAGNITTQLPPGVACRFDIVVDAGAMQGATLPIEQANIAGSIGCNPTAGQMCTTTVTDADGGSDPGQMGVVEAHIVSVGSIIGPQINQGTPTFGSTTNIAGGFLGGSAITQNISFSASSGAQNGGTTDLVCVDDDADTSLSAAATQNNIGGTTTPTTIVASFTPAAARTVTVDCTATRDGVAMDQTFSYTFEVAAGQPPTGPTIVAGSPAFNSSTNVNGGVQGGANVTQNISFGASTGGGGGGTTDLSCSTDIGNLSNGTQNDIASGFTPTTMQFSIAPDSSMARTATVTCSATADGGGMQNWTYTFEIAQASILVGPTLTPPGNLTLNVGGGVIGATTTANIVYSAANGDADQTTNLTCVVATGMLSLQNANQDVETGTNPLPVVVSVQLTDAQQNPAGTVECTDSLSGNTTTFTINAPAGLVFVPPEVVPATSLWSQLALIGLLAALGGFIVAVRRNA